MKWTSVTVAALASAATACTVDLGNEVTCPTKTYDNVVANVHSLPLTQPPSYNH